LLSVVGKVLTIIRSRIKDHREERISEQQVGFMAADVWTTFSVSARSLSVEPINQSINQSINHLFVP